MVISKSQIKRNLKKIEKIKLRLTNKNGIIFTDEHSETIVVANAGLANDVKRHELELHLSQFSDNIKEIITLSHLTFAIVICHDSNSAAEIVANLQAFTVSTPDLPLRPTVNAFCMYAKLLPTDLTTEVVDFSSSKPPGLTVIDEFVTVEEESLLISYFMDLQAAANSQLKHRSVLHFGYTFNYDTNRADASQPLADRPIPDCCRVLLDRYEQRYPSTLPQGGLNQLTVNIYWPGDGIPPHTDTHSGFGEEIVSISLESPVTIDWTLPASSTISMTTDIAARSLLVMSGESRYLWRHGIASRRSDPIRLANTSSSEQRARSRRLSLTFRAVLATSECRCAWPAACDSPRDRADRDSTGSTDPVELERRFVHRVYDAIAPHFSATRHRMWPRVRQFIERCLATVPGAIGADLGCGNGKYFPAMLATSGGDAPRGALLAVDASFELCRIAATVTTPVASGLVSQAHCMSLPFRDDCCDYAISIAVLHHLGSEERRRLALSEMARLLRRGGRALVYVWARQQRDKDGHESAYVAAKKPGKSQAPVSRTIANGDGKKVDTGGIALPVHESRTEFATSDVLVPWTKATPSSSDTGVAPPSPQVFSRYYHVFEEGELEQLCGQVPGIAVIDHWYDSGNWAVVFEKRA